MLTTLNNLRLLLLASWIGAAIFFSAVVAPTAFRVLRAFNLPNAGEIAGTIVTQALSVVNTTGVIVSLLSLVIALVIRKSYMARALTVQVILLGVVTVSTAVGEWVIAARMRSLRAAMRLPIDQMPVGDPGRLEFDTLHGYSVAALSVAIIAALIAFFVIATQSRLK
jgi:hypothetical protein